MSTTITVANRDEEHERLLGIVFNISPAQAAVLSCIMRSTAVTTDELQRYSGNKSHVKIAVSRVRARLKEYGYDINSKKDVGYWIEPDDKKGLEGLVNDFTKGN